MNVNVKQFLNKLNGNQEILTEFNQYLRELPSKRSIQRSKNTNYNNLSTIKKLLEFIENDLDNYTKINIENWIQGYKAKYAAFSKVKNFTKFLYEKNYIEEETYKQIMKMRFKNSKNGKKKYAIQKREWNNVINQVSGVRKFAVWLLLNTGIRVGELIHLETTDIIINHKTKQYYLKIQDKSLREIKWYPKSDSSIRDIRLSPRMINVIEDYLKIRKSQNLPHKFLLYNTKTNRFTKRGERIKYESTINKWMKDITILDESINESCVIKNCKENKPHRHISPHETRYSFASHMYYSGRDKGYDSLHEVSKLLGHSNPQTTGIYLQLDKKELESRIERLYEIADM